MDKVPLNISLTKIKKEEIKKILDLQDSISFETFQVARYMTRDEYIKLRKKEYDHEVKTILDEIVNSNHMWLAAKDGSKIIGFIHCVKKENYGQIRSLFIDPDYQGTGLGRKFMTIALEWLADFERIILFVVEFNAKAISFYEKFGFKLTNEEPNQQNPLYRRVKMIRNSSDRAPYFSNVRP